MTVQELEAKDSELLSLLRTKGLSIKGLDDQTRARLRGYLESLTGEKGMSLNDVSKLIGNKTSGYSSWVCKQLGVTVRPFEEARLKGIKEKRRKYERRPFDGTDEDKAYLLGLRHGDLSVSRPWNGVVRVSTSTTHPAMAELFRSLFEPYGHVYQHPRYKKDTKTYEWNLSAIVDDSFEFLFSTVKDSSEWILSKPSITLAYLAGLLDAEGSVGIYPAKLLVSLNVVYYNTNLELLKFVLRAAQALGFHPLPPYLDKKKGFRSPGYHIEMKKDYWRVLFAKFDECQAFLKVLPARHSEKRRKKDLALEIRQGDFWEVVGPRVLELRTSIREARDQMVAEAKRIWDSNPRHQSISPDGEVPS